MTKVVRHPHGVIGIDPGANGAICALYTGTKGNPTIVFLDHAKTTPLEQYTWLKEMQSRMVIFACSVEDVHSLPGMSAKSNFSFGGAVHTTKTILAIAQQEYTLIQPKIWQKAVGVPAKVKGKSRSPKQLKLLVAARCRELFPDCDIYGPRGGLLDGRSDALMLAYSYFIIDNHRMRQNESSDTNVNMSYNQNSS